MHRKCPNCTAILNQYGNCDNCGGPFLNLDGYKTHFKRGRPPKAATSTAAPDAIRRRATNPRNGKSKSGIKEPKYFPLELTPAQEKIFRSVWQTEQMLMLDGKLNKGRQFEFFVGYLFRQEGYNVEITQHGRDEGIDLRITNPVGIKALVSCKCYKQPVSKEKVQAFVKTVEDHNYKKGCLVTTSSVSAPMTAYSKRAGVEVIQGQTLVNWAVNINNIAGRPPESVSFLGAVGLIIGSIFKFRKRE